MSVITQISAPGSGISATVFAGPWATGTIYRKNQQVALNGDLYLCIATHTAGASTQPGIGVDWTDAWTRQIDSVNADQLAAIAGADNPNASNVFPTMAQENIIMTAGEPLDAYKVIYLAVDGKVYLAQNDGSEIQASPFGITLESIDTDTTGTIRVRSGFITNPIWTWTVGGQLYLHEDGELTQTLPGETDFVVSMGVAISDTKIYFHPQEGILNPVIWYNSNIFEIDYVPANYTPVHVPGITTSATQLAAHLAGIDAQLAGS